MNTRFRRRLLLLVVALTSAVACAGLVVAMLFERALQQTVSLEADTGRILRAARELQFTVAEQRGLYTQILFLPPGPSLDAARAEFARGRARVLRQSSALQQAVQGHPEFEVLARSYLEVLQEQRYRADTAAPPNPSPDLASRVAAGARQAAQASDPLLSRLIDGVRARQATEMSAMDASVESATRRLVLMFLVVVIAIGIGVFLYLDRAFARPMLRSIHIAGDVAAGGLHARIPVDRDDEFGVFALAFNRMLEELAGIHARLEEANRELESFSYTISHDLRAPLRSINGFATMLREDAEEQLDPAARGYLQRIEAASERMGSMIEDILAISRIGRGELDCSTVDLSALAEAVIAELRAHDPARVTSVVIEPGISAWGDAGLLRVVLHNLLGNAWKYTGRSAAPHIEFLRAAREGQTGFVVRDNGAGFDPAFASRLFRPFQRLHANEEFEGTGIGLATVHRIVLRHGGRIEASAQPGHGASFHVWLPPASAHALAAR